MSDRYKRQVDSTKRNHGEDFYNRIGKKGAETYIQRQKEGTAKPRGFAAMTPEKRRAAGQKGGQHVS